ncbi:MAG: methyltransferase domain-containing protein [Anaerolineae bacterium]|nr:methyltransferase domain-containing protein [Anaerolineae bacterium]
MVKLEYRTGEWPGKMRAEMVDGRVFELEKFYANYLIPFHIMQRCLTCTDLTNEFADIAGGDAWAPIYEERGKGWSLVLGRTAHGQALLDEMQAAGKLDLTPVTEHDAMTMHSHMLDFKKRGAFMRMARRRWLGLQSPRYDYAPLAIPWRRRAFEWVIDLIFVIGAWRLVHRIVEALPVRWTGRVFMWARDRWKRMTYRAKREGMAGLRFSYTLDGVPHEDPLSQHSPTLSEATANQPLAKGIRLQGMLARARLEYQYMMQPTWTLADVGAHWDATEDYDDINAETYSYFRRFIDGLALTTISDQSLILDVCCRTGNGTGYFYQHGKVRHAICADVSRRMLDIAGRYLSELGVPHETLYFEMYPLPLADASVEAILCFETAEHVPDPEAFLRELGRVIQPGGEMILTTPNILWEPVHWLAAILGLHHSEGPHRFLRHRRLCRAVQAAGFTIERNIGTVLIPDGPEWLTSLGRWLEGRLPTLARWLALRRILICRRQ